MSPIIIIIIIYHCLPAPKQKLFHRAGLFLLYLLKIKWVNYLEFIPSVVSCTCESISSILRRSQNKWNKGGENKINPLESLREHQRSI